MNNKPELLEKDFIQNSNKSSPFPFWIWLFLIAVVVSLFLGGRGWYTDRLNNLFNVSPFLQVTNREISLFLWQNPEFMRINAKQKLTYLPAFKYLDKITIDLAEADQYTSAPPELLFRYHAWKRLIFDEFIPLPIPKQTFQDFLSYAQEWQPAYFATAPDAYKHLIDGLAANPISDLATLSLDVLPISVRIAFQGWYNYFKDGESINTLVPTRGQMHQFLKNHPHYARNYWINLVNEQTPNYLKSLNESGDENPQDENSALSSNELTSFLRVAIFNYLKAQKIK